MYFNDVVSMQLECRLKKRYFSRFIEMIKSDEVPKIRGSIVGRTGKDYRSWKRGVVISIRNKKIAGIVIMLKHNADVHYRHVFPGYRWYEKAEAGIKSQLKELIGNGRLKEDDIIVVDFEDYEANTYDNSYTIEVKISELLPFLV